MKHAKVILVLFTFLFIFGSMNIAGNNAMAINDNARSVELNESVVLSYMSHGVISIIGDTDFETQATAEMWPGDGLSDTPYLIQGYNITNDAQVSIAISDVSVYFEIRDCLITSTSHENVGGVTLNNVTHAHLENCIISYKNTGLEIDNSDGITVVNCTMDNNAAGATVDLSNHTTFTRCYFTNTTTGSGFYQDNSHWTTVSDSYLIGNGDFGGESFDSDYLTFTGNDVSDNDISGFFAMDSAYGFYEFNAVYDNGDEGFFLYDSPNTTMTQNMVYNNWGEGIHLSGAYDSVFSWNTVYHNRMDGISIDTGSDSVVDSNRVYDNGWIQVGATASGINVEFTINCSVTGNTVYNNSRHGIYVAEYHEGVIHDNVVYGNFGIPGLCGIYVFESNFCNVTSNIVYNNTENGISIMDSVDCRVTHNIVYDNTNTGIYLGDSNRTLIYFNDIGWNPTSAYSSVASDFINYWDNGVVGNWWSNYNNTGVYNISGPTGEQDMHPSRSIALGPISDTQYEAGSTGNTILVEAQALNPWRYTVFSGSTNLDHGTWDGGDINATIDGLPIGDYSVTIEVYHVSGHQESIAIAVTVADTTAPEWVITPNDQTVGVGQPFSYQVSVTDLSPIGEWIVNDTVHFNIVDGLITNNTVLEFGDYGLNITVVDVHGNARSIVITIRVAIAVARPDLMGLILIVGGVGVTAVLVVVLIIFKKKRS